MADEQSPTVEIAPTIIVSNSSGEENPNGLEHDSIEIAGAIADAIADNDGTNGLPSHSEGSTTDDPLPLVAVAEIEAGRDIALASIESEVERERIELENKRLDNNEEYQECRREIAALMERVETLANLLTPPPQLAEAIAEELEIALEPNLTEPSMQVPTVEIMTEPLEESVDERQEAEIPNRGRKYIAI